VDKHRETANFIWSVVDPIRDSFNRHKYQDVILPLTVLRPRAAAGRWYRASSAFCLCCRAWGKPVCGEGLSEEAQVELV
jgi:hypothetical protein